jgi:hypothetical protein
VARVQPAWIHSNVSKNGGVVAWMWRNHMVRRPASMANRAAGVTTAHTGCWWFLNQPDIRLKTWTARKKSLAQLLAHRIGHRAVPETLMMELHGRLR